MKSLSENARNRFKYLQQAACCARNHLGAHVRRLVLGSRPGIFHLGAVANNLREQADGQILLNRLQLTS